MLGVTTVYWSVVAVCLLFERAQLQWLLLSDL